MRVREGVRCYVYGVSSSRECPYKYDDIMYVGELRCWIRNEKIGDVGVERVARGGGMNAIKSIKNM